MTRGSGRARGRAQRPATPDPAVKDPLAKLAALDDGTLETVSPEAPLPDIVPAQRSNGDGNGHSPDVLVDSSPLPPVARSTAIDAAIPTAAVPATKPLKPFFEEQHTSVIEALNEPPPPPTRSTPLVVAEPEPELAPVVVEPKPSVRPVIWRRKTRPRVRRVTRVLRHIDTWSVFKVALVFNLVAYLVSLTAAVLLWNVAYRTGTIDNVEKFFEQFGWSSFQFRGGELYHNLWIAGLFIAVGFTGLAVMLATLFNLITDLVGGIRVSVLEEEVITSRAEQRAEPAPAAPTQSVLPVATPDEGGDVAPPGLVPG